MELYCIGIRLAGLGRLGTFRGLSGLYRGGRVCTFATSCMQHGTMWSQWWDYRITPLLWLWKSFGWAITAPSQSEHSTPMHGSEEEDCQVLTVKLSYLMIA